MSYHHQPYQPDLVYALEAEENCYGPTKADLIFLAEAEAQPSHKARLIFLTRNPASLIAFFMTLAYLKVSSSHPIQSAISIYRSATINLLIAELEPYLEDPDNPKMHVFQEAALQAYFDLEELRERSVKGVDEMAAVELIEGRVERVSAAVLKVREVLMSRCGKRKHELSSTDSQYQRHNLTPGFSYSSHHHNPGHSNPTIEATRRAVRNVPTRIPSVILNSKRLQKQKQYHPPNNGTYQSPVQNDISNTVPKIFNPKNPKSLAPTPCNSPNRPQTPTRSFTFTPIITRADTPNTRSHYRTSSTLNSTIGLRRTASSIITPGLGLDLNLGFDFSIDRDKEGDTSGGLHPAHARSSSNLTHLGVKSWLETPPRSFHTCSTSGLSLQGVGNRSPDKLSTPDMNALNPHNPNLSNIISSANSNALTESWGLTTPKRSFSAGGFHARTGSFLGEVEAGRESEESKPPSRMGKSVSSFFPVSSVKVEKDGSEGVSGELGEGWKRNKVVSVMERDVKGGMLGKGTPIIVEPEES